MLTSQVRIEANRKNARMSTGPKSEAGKNRSRANALKHGLCSLTVVAETEELIRERTDAFVEEFQPEGEYPLWLAGQAALASLRIERCQRMERGVRDKVSIKAELCWDDDRRLDAVRLGQSIAKAPEFVVEQLRQTPQGCEWLISRWALLAHAADSSKQGWTPEQAALAYDLFGTPVAFREGLKPGTSIDSKGRVLESANDLAAVARRMVDELESRRELVAGIDEAKQALAWLDLDDEADPELKRVRRYESSLQRRLRWCLDQLENPSIPDDSPPPRDPKDVRIGLGDPPPEPEPFPEPEPMAVPAVMPVTAALPASSPSPGVEALIAAGRFSNIDLPYGIKPFGSPTLAQFVERPQPVDRAEKKLQKADARREAHRRKLEKSRS